MKKKRALITGITGQDGSYLAELLLEKGYEVHGLKRRTSLFNTERIDHLYVDPHEAETNFFLHYADLTDSTNLIRLIQEIEPDEIYNLAAQSHVKVSFETPEYTANADALGTLRLLEAIRLLHLEEKTKFYQASTSEMFGDSPAPQNEETPFRPRSPYAAAKVYAYWIVKNYREAYNIFAVNGILFNHESARRGETFVTRKITRAAARIRLALQQKLYLGNLNAFRDWGHAKDYVHAMYLMMQHHEPLDLVIATGESHSVREFAQLAFRQLGIEIEFFGSGLNEKARIVKVEPIDELSETIKLKVGSIVIEVDPKYFRPTEVEFLQGDPSKAKEILKWKPKYTFQDLVREMALSDYELAKKELLLKKNGYRIEGFQL